MANEDGWILSDPTQVNSWFESLVGERNKELAGWGTQLRHLIHFLKRFCRSRKAWIDELPNGMKLTMLVAECQADYSAGTDIAFRNLIANLNQRLETTKVIENLAHPELPKLTRTDADANVVALLEKVSEAVDQLESLDETSNDNERAARKVWEWMFQSDGFFSDYDASAKVEKSEGASARSAFDVPWRERPPWPIDERYAVSLSGKFGNSEHGVNWNSIQANGPPLKKHLYLRFQAATNTPTPYRVFWQIVNTGGEAINAGSLRGQIVESLSVGAGGLQSTTAPGPLRRERTLYTGMHWVECFIVRNGTCVARSGPFVVNIQ